MSLYHEAAAILNSTHNGGGSIKSLVYGKKGYKSDPKTLFALSTEAAKWSEVVSEVIEKSEILKNEKQLSPTLVLVLTHDLLLSKRGIALPASHGLHSTVARHKARLIAELTKARLRRKCASLDQLRAQIGGQKNASVEGDAKGPSTFKHPRWVRVNTLRSTLEEQLSSTFADYVRMDKLSDVMESAATDAPMQIYIDNHIPDLVAIPSTVEIATTKASKEGRLILQDKASCFPAYLLEPALLDGHIIDACAAPGNKTTHLAGLISKRPSEGGAETAPIIACEKDAVRSQTLEKMVKLAGADELVRVKAKQDFLRLDPQAPDFSKVTGLLLDPSCSGSGIIGRDEASVTVHLPHATAVATIAPKGKKRKRDAAHPPVEAATAPDTAVDEELPVEGDTDAKLQARLASLSAFQLRVLQHAMKFPSAQRITYSTCSVHAVENEHVVMKALRSPVARERGWRIMKRQTQVDGMCKWHERGWLEACQDIVREEDDGHPNVDAVEVAEACIRCVKGSKDGTMGFFLAGFVRDGLDVTSGPGAERIGNEQNEARFDNGSGGLEAEWNGFDDD